MIGKPRPAWCPRTPEIRPADLSAQLRAVLSARPQLAVASCVETVVPTKCSIRIAQ